MRLTLQDFKWEQIVKKIEDSEPFTFVRYGDGEFQCMLEYSSNLMNCDKHMYFPKLGKMLRMSFICAPQIDNYIVGLQLKAVQDAEKHITAFIEQNNISRPWYNADVIHNASTDGIFVDAFKKLCESGYAAYVGPARCSNICKNFIEVPPVNCWLAYEHIKAQMINAIQSNITTFFISASMPAKVLMFEIYQMYGDSVQMIDLGSVIEPYIGNPNRRYHSQIMERLKWLK